MFFNRNEADPIGKASFFYLLLLCEIVCFAILQKLHLILFREKIDLTNTTAFGEKNFSQTIDLTGKKWIRLEAWDAAVNGAFTQTIWIQ